MELLHNLSWPTVSNIIRSETATTMYKSLNGLVTEYLSDLFVKNSTRNVRELRNTETDLSLPLRKTKNGQNAISFRGPKLWNQLELDLIKQTPSLATFKKKIKKLIRMFSFFFLSISRCLFVLIFRFLPRPPEKQLVINWQGYRV